MTTDKVNLQDVLETSQILGNLAEAYGPLYDKLTSVMITPGMFETSQVTDAWGDLMSAMWNYCADSQNNLNDTSRTLVRYINAVCATDDDAAQDLKDEIHDHNTALENTESGSGGNEYELDEPLPEPDMDNPDQMFDEPDYEDAPRPEGSAS